MFHVCLCSASILFLENKEEDQNFSFFKTPNFLLPFATLDLNFDLNLCTYIRLKIFNLFDNLLIKISKRNYLLRRKKSKME
jgi:hypothetical protein